MEAIFISDLHLQDERPDLTEGFVRFCEKWATQSRKLYILGDLFEVWIGDDVETTTSRAVIGALSMLASRGTQVAFLAGNRDFLIGNDFASTAALNLLVEDECLQEISAQPVLLSHGDIYCTEDTQYQAFRKIMRDRGWIDAFLQKSVSARQEMARALRKESMSQGKEKQLYLMDVAESAILAAFQNSPARLMIHGHTHRPGIHTHALNDAVCKRIVLGDWSETGWMATIEDGTSHLFKFPIKTPQQVHRYEN